MIEIDGSFGEGGGQILRTAIALASITWKPVRIRNIRQNRPKPGLSPQHAQAIEALAMISHARTSGVRARSTEITFQPGEIRGGRYHIDIGTAGSVTQLMQCLLPAMIKAETSTSLEVHGGTDVLWSPTVDYFQHVFLSALGSFGAKAILDIRQRGYYPRGNGFVLLKVEPKELKPAHFKPHAKGFIEGISHCSNLPEHVARRQAESASQALKEAGYEATVGVQVLELPSTGSGITLWSGYKGGSALGERGVRAEAVGKTAADELILELRSRAAVNVHLADQLIPYLALAGGSYTTREISMHTKTNIWTAKHFLDKEITVHDEGIFRIAAVSELHSEGPENCQSI